MSRTHESLESQSFSQWELEQLVKSGIFPNRDAVLRSALRALYQLHPEIKIKMIVNAYAVGEMSLGKAANLLSISQEEMKDILRERNVSLHFGPQGEQEVFDDASHA